MFDLVLNMPFICNANTSIDWLLFDTNFYRKVFSKQVIEISILIPIIPIIQAKNISTKFDKTQGLF